MLNFFLVLGLIPGTNIQLTFNEILLVTILLVVSFRLYGRRPKISIKQEIVQLSRLHSFSYPIPASPPVKSTVRKVEVLPINIVALHLGRVARLIRQVV